MVWFCVVVRTAPGARWKLMRVLRSALRPLRGIWVVAVLTVRIEKGRELATL